MPDLMTVWNDTGKKKLRKQYLIKRLREANKTFCDLYCDKELRKVIGFQHFVI